MIYWVKFNRASTKNAYVTSLSLGGLSLERQKPLAVQYKGIDLDCGYRLDVVVENAIILELKSCDKIEPIYPVK